MGGTKTDLSRVMFETIWVGNLEKKIEPCTDNNSSRHH